MRLSLLTGSLLAAVSAVTHAQQSTVPVGGSPPEHDQQTVDVQGHRGCRGLRPENTVPAFIHALALGVTTLELDVVVSQDQQLVVSHEPYLSHLICTGPHGEEITAAQEKQYNLYQMPYAEIRRCDCGSQQHPDFPEQQTVAAPKPLLTDMIDSVEQYLRQHNRPPVGYNIEIKSSPAGDGVYHPAPKEFVSLLLAVINEKGIVERTNLQSFDVRPLQEARRQAPTLRQALLVGNPGGIRKNLKELGYVPEIYSPHFGLVNKKLRDYTREQGMQLIPWTVNERDDIRKMLDLEVDGIISDYPGRVLELVNG